MYKRQVSIAEDAGAVAREAEATSAGSRIGEAKVASTVNGTKVASLNIDREIGVILKTKKDVKLPSFPQGSQWERNILNSFTGGRSKSVTYKSGTTLYRIGGKNGGFWSLEPPPLTEYQWRTDYAIKQEFCNDASTLYRITIPEESTISGLEGTVGSQGMGLYGGVHQVYIDYMEVPTDWIEKTQMIWK